MKCEDWACQRRSASVRTFASVVPKYFLHPPTSSLNWFMYNTQPSTATTSLDMLLIRRSVLTQRSLLAVTGRYPLSREYHGDPGPSSSSFRQAEQRRFLRTVTDGRANGQRRTERDILPRRVSAPILSQGREGYRHAARTTLGAPGVFPLARRSGGPAPREGQRGRLFTPGPPNERGGSSRAARSRSSSAPRGSRTSALRRADTPYDTSRQLRNWIDSHRSPVSEADLYEAGGIVMNAMSKAVNTPVWNQLLALYGRESSIEKLLRLFNDASRFIS